MIRFYTSAKTNLRYSNINSLKVHFCQVLRYYGSSQPFWHLYQNQHLIGIKFSTAFKLSVT